jgi:transcription antitermination factor NusG
VNDKKGMVKVSINLLGRETPVELEFAGIKVSK